MRQAERIAVGSILVGVVVLGLKLAAWWLTGSAALFSDAAESVVNVVASVVALAFPVLAVPLLLVAASVAASRVVLGLHFLSDVLAGSAIGALIGVSAFHYLLG